jgi:hypothetical protein
MPFVTPNTPNLLDFQTWLTTDVQIPTSAWPSGGITVSNYPQYALNQAVALVLNICGVPGFMYTLAVYNCATAILFSITPDTAPSTYFADARSTVPSPNFPNGGFGLNQVSTGLVVASSDEGTSVTLTAPTWAADLTVGQLGFMKTIWGRYYLDFIEKYGTIWGLS